MERHFFSKRQCWTEKNFFAFSFPQIAIDVDIFDGGSFYLDNIGKWLESVLCKVLINLCKCAFCLISRPLLALRALRRDPGRLHDPGEGGGPPAGPERRPRSKHGRDGLDGRGGDVQEDGLGGKAGG